MLAFDRFSNFYKLVLVLHILSVVVGIGAVMLNGIYASQSQKRPGPGGRAISEANFFVSDVAEKVIYTIPVWGILLVLLSDKGWKFTQLWIWLSFLLYIAAIGISHAIMIPGHKRINVLLAEMETSPPSPGGPPPQSAELQATGQRLAMGGMTLNLIVVVIIALMVFKPGFN